MALSSFIKPAIAGVCLCFSTLTIAASTQIPPPKMFGGGIPFQASDLPDTRFRTELQALPAISQKKAIIHLNTFRFSELDLPFLHADQGGGIYYADTFLIPPPHNLNTRGTASASPARASIQAITSTEAFSLHSKPGASNVVYLDFNGHTITGTWWNDDSDFGSITSWEALPYDIDGNTSSFSSDELTNIFEVWRRVAEDYAPFNIDVTTEEPASFTNTTGRVLITPGTDKNGKLLPWGNSSGGVAYVNVWGKNYYAADASPAFVYSNMLGNWADNIAEAASHELGHNLGLSHDGTVAHDNVKAEGYYAGHGTGYVSWGPIMGVGYYTNVTQWSKGEYTYANNTQDDLSIIQNYLGLRTDDHAGNTSGATPLNMDASGNILSTTPATDPGNTNPANKGIIQSKIDVDFFTFNTSGGTINLQATPLKEIRQGYTRGGNLDIQLTLYDANGNPLASSDPITDTNASISTTLGFGTYYLSVDGVGNTTSPYSDYASLGQYFLSGAIPPIQDDADDDNDGMPDTWETQYGFNPMNPSDASGDADNDGLTNLQEYNLGTNPSKQDSDSDGINDKDEVDQGRNPAVDERVITIIPILMELLQ
jgi:hypothetical protein